MSPIDPYSGFGAGTLMSVWDLHDSLEQYTHDSDEGKVKIKWDKIPSSEDQICGTPRSKAAMCTQSYDKMFIICDNGLGQLEKNKQSL